MRANDGGSNPRTQIIGDDYLPLYAERRCILCGYWRGQHIGESVDDNEMHCPTTFLPEPVPEPPTWTIVQSWDNPLRVRVAEDLHPSPRLGSTARFKTSAATLHNRGDIDLDTDYVLLNSNSTPVDGWVLHVRRAT